MKYELQVKRPYEVTFTDLVYVPSNSDTFKGLDHEAKEKSDGTYDGPAFDEITFEESWIIVAVAAGVHALETYDDIDGAHLYLGYWHEGVHDGSPEQRAVAVLGKDMDVFGQDIMYTGWRVTVSCHEGAWDYS